MLFNIPFHSTHSGKNNKNIFIPYKIQINLHFFSLKLVYSE